MQASPLGSHPSAGSGTAYNRPRLTFPRSKPFASGGTSALAQARLLSAPVAAAPAHHRSEQVTLLALAAIVVLSACVVLLSLFAFVGARTASTTREIPPVPVAASPTEAMMVSKLTSRVELLADDSKVLLQRLADFETSFSSRAEALAADKSAEAATTIAQLKLAVEKSAAELNTLKSAFAEANLHAKTATDTLATERRRFAADWERISAALLSTERELASVRSQLAHREAELSDPNFLAARSASLKQLLRPAR